jgi:hypothetical protein
MRLEGLDGFPIQFSNSHGPLLFRVVASASEAIHRAAQKEWIASSLSLLVMTANRDTPAPSRDALAPGSCKKSCAPKEQRAQGMPGARRTHSLACEMKKYTRVSHHRFAGSTQHSLRNGFNGFLRALPGDEFLLSPSSAD